jgi:transmembrane sensor
MRHMTEPRKASEWLLALKDNPADQRLRDAFSVWYSQKPEHAASWLKAVKAYKLMGEVPAEFSQEWQSETTKDRSTVTTASNVTPFKKRKKWIAAVAAAACLVLALFATTTQTPHGDYITAQGEIRDIVLSDGSHVHLASSSRINVRYSDGFRDIELLEGQAFFDVTRHPDRPFRVQTGQALVSVLGTAFDIDKSADHVSVAVKEGTVSVQPTVNSKAPQILKKGDAIDVAEDGTFARFTTSSDYIAAWRDGRFIVNDRPAGEVVAALKRYYNGVVVLHGDKLKDHKITGMYLLSKPNVALKALAQTIGAEVYQITPWMLVISAG